MKDDMRVWTVAAALALLVLGMQLRDALPSAQQVAAAPFIYGNQAPIIGEVDDVRATLTENLNGVPTNAVWLVLDFAYIKDAQTVPSVSVKSADGKEYLSESNVLGDCSGTYPGLRSTCTMVVEIPREQLPGANINFSIPSRMGPLMVIPLDPIMAQANEVPELVREGMRI